MIFRSNDWKKFILCKDRMNVNATMTQWERDRVNKKNWRRGKRGEEVNWSLLTDWKILFREKIKVIAFKIAVFPSIFHLKIKIYIYIK